MASEIDDELIDKCSEYVVNKDCSYLAKEGFIVYFASVTGRKSDYLWHKQTISETLRIIRALFLSSDLAVLLREHHLISAFQELDKVYEFGTKSRHQTVQGVFNYTSNSDNSLGDEAMSLTVEALQLLGITAILLTPVVDLFQAVQTKLKLNLGKKECKDLLYKHFEASGFTIKTGPHRPLIDGKKQPVIMLNGTKPSEVVGLRKLEASRITTKIYGELS